jgi:hypothetical protein
MRLLTILFALLLWWPLTDASGRIYQYTDENGVVHFTDSLSNIPEGQRPEVESIGGEESAPEPQDSEKPPGQEGTGAVEEKPVPQEGAKEGSELVEDKEIPFIDDLNKERAALEAEHAKLEKKKASLQKKRETLKTPEQVRAYQKKIRDLNREIEAYQKRNRAFQKKADAFNEAVKEEDI